MAKRQQTKLQEADFKPENVNCYWWHEIATCLAIEGDFWQ